KRRNLFRVLLLKSFISQGTMTLFFKFLNHKSQITNYKSQVTNHKSQTFKRINAPSFCFFLKHWFCYNPNFFEKIAVSIVFQIGFPIPTALCEKDCFVVFIIVKFQKSAARKISDPVFDFFKIRQKSRNVLFFKFHFYNSCKHLFSYGLWVMSSGLWVMGYEFWVLGSGFWVLGFI